MRTTIFLLTLLTLAAAAMPARAQDGEIDTPVPPDRRVSIDQERRGTHDANRIRTRFFNFGMVGDFQTNPDLSVFHSAEVPKGTGVNYTDGITPFVLAKVEETNGETAYIMETGYRERQARSPVTGRIMRYEPRPGYVQTDPAINQGRSIAISNDPRTWPDCWVDKRNDPDDPGWCGSWNGYFGKRPNADQESYFVMGDNYYDAWDFYPDSRDSTRRGLGLRVEVRGFQWSNPQARNVIFWHYDIVNESTTDYEDIIFGLYMDSGVGGSAVSCDGVAESDDDNAFYTTEFGQDLVYTWDKNGRGVGLSGNCIDTGYLGYAYLETPGNPFDGTDNDDDGLTDERRDSGPGRKIEGQGAIRDYVESNYDLAAFEEQIGALETRPAFEAGVWWTGDEDLDWMAEFSDTGADGVMETGDTGEGDDQPTGGEPDFDDTDVDESDQIGLTGFKFNRIRAGQGNPSSETDNIVFYDSEDHWPRRLYEQFSAQSRDERFDDPLAENYNIGFLFASGPFRLPAQSRQRFSLALAYGAGLTELRTNVNTVQQIYDANYQFAVPPSRPVVKASTSDGAVTLTWNNQAEKSVDPVSNEQDFEGYRIYRSTDPNFLDPQNLTINDPRTARVISPNGDPLVQFDLDNSQTGYTDMTVDGLAYYLGDNSGITHTFTDTTVTNGQRYYYAVTAYDRGSQELGFFPSENSIAVSRTRRGGTILPSNVVQVRPNASVPGYVGAAVRDGSVQQAEGQGAGSVDVRVLNNQLVPDGHTFRLAFRAPEDSIHAQSYSLIDATTDSVLFTGGTDFDADGTGPVGRGLQPLIDTPQEVSVNPVQSGFTSGSPTNAALRVRYANALPIGRRRPGFPDDLAITFGDQPLDTSLAAIGQPSTPARFKIESLETGRRLDFRFRDTNGDNTLSAPGEFVEIVTYTEERPSTPQATWNVRLDTSRIAGSVQPPAEGDAYRLVTITPFTDGDAFTFETRGARVEDEQAESDYAEQKPYVVPNPYVAAADFEPERFATSGRGERRLEFRHIPAGATIRIYTVRGELVQTLEHGGSTTSTVPWDLRTRDDLELAPGLYVFHVESGDLDPYVGKFAVIK